MILRRDNPASWVARCCARAAWSQVGQGCGTEPARVRGGGPVDGVPAAPGAGRVTGLRDEVLLHVVEEAVVVVLDPARPGNA